MDIDMHYYGTYALALAAGLRQDAAHRIATAAEFVDDSTDTDVIVHPDGARFRGESTAHHPTDLAPNNDLDDQQQVWVPFHFLPGNEGTTQSQRLICRRNSAVVQTMCKHHLDWADRPYALELIGITAHVYADTFAHYGFSGVSSRVNRVVADSFNLVNGDPLATPPFDRFVARFGVQGGLLKNFRTRLVSTVAEDLSGALGHGAVATFPDQPFLEWSYAYELPDQAGQTTVSRQNANDFEEGAEALHGLFRDFAARRADFADGSGGIDFAALRPFVRTIVTAIAKREDRIAAWKAAIAAAHFSKTGVVDVEDYDHEPWRRQTESLSLLPQPEMASQVPVYHFHQAAAMHRNYVLRELLPSVGIYII